MWVITFSACSISNAGNLMMLNNTSCECDCERDDSSDNSDEVDQCTH